MGVGDFEAVGDNPLLGTPTLLPVPTLILNNATLPTFYNDFFTSSSTL